MDATHPLVLTLGGEALVEAFGAELRNLVAPGRQEGLEALRALAGLPMLHQLLLENELAQDADERFEGDVLGDHELVVLPPAVLEDRGRALEVIPEQPVGLLGFLEELGPGLDELVDLVEELGLQNPLLLPRAAAEAVDLVLEGRVVGTVEQIDDLGGELLLGAFPGNLLVEVDQVRLVDARVGRVDDDEHLGREVGALAVEDHAGDFDLVGLLGMPLLEEVEARDAVLAVDHEEQPARLAQVAHRLVVPQALELQGLVGEEQDGSGDERLGSGGLEEIDDRLDLAAVQRTLKRLVALLDGGDEVGNLVVAGGLRRDAFAFEMEAADEADLAKEVGGLVAHEVEGPFLLADAGSKHNSIVMGSGNGSSRPSPQERGKSNSNSNFPGNGGPGVYSKLHEGDAALRRGEHMGVVWGRKPPTRCVSWSSLRTSTSAGRRSTLV